MSTAKIEFAVEMSCGKCEEKVRGCLSALEGVKVSQVSLEKQSVVVETNQPSTIVLDCIRATGLRAVMKGYGGDVGIVPGPQVAAVAMLGGETGCGLGPVKGVVRFLQTEQDRCLIDGTIDGLEPGHHGLHIHELGDLSGGCDTIGPHLNLRGTRHGGPHEDEDNRHTSLCYSTHHRHTTHITVTAHVTLLQHTGDLGNIKADVNGRAVFRFEDKLVKVGDIIGRSVAVNQGPDDPASREGDEQRIACGIIARSAGMFENSKRICACDGVELWDEKDRPLTGPSRRNTGHL
uniref:Superoxide dismutase copper chaperone n=1 Tax=Timema shepardi TaxID=629360 RepID=A0A7R9B7T6_TIMSH|nr:unnamed protein product [Timema shepardi]